MRILFVVDRGPLLRFALLIPALVEQGHDVHIAFVRGNNWRRRRGVEARPPRTGSLALAEELAERHPGVTFDQAPEREPDDGWNDVTWVVRGLADLAHNAQPRYADADVLRRRTAKRVLAPLRKSADFDPVTRRLALRKAEELTGPTDAERARSTLALAAGLEAAVPTNGAVDRYVRGLAPDAVVATGTFRHISGEVELLKSARKLGIPTGIFVASWDNLTNKGALKFMPDLLFVWNETQLEEAVELHGVPRERIRITGAHVFDDWFERTPSRSAGELLADAGLDPSEPYLVYLCSSRNIVGENEVDFVRSWIEALRASGEERLERIGVIVRPHPNANAPWEGVQLEDSRAAIWPRLGIHPVAAQARADFYDTLAHAAAVVGINTTAMIEAAILGKSVLTVLVPSFAQEATLHFHNLLAENGGFLHVATSLDEHVGQLRLVLAEDEAGAERRRRFVESFVRPAGIDQPAAPVAAEAIGELGSVRPDPPARAGVVPFAGVRVAAAVAAVHARRRPPVESAEAKEERKEKKRAAAAATKATSKSRRAWDDLGELEEYEALARVRLDHAVPVRQPLVLISQIQRSGGTLLSRFFDGHPECHAHPYELKIGRGKHHPWPELDLARPESWFDSLYEKEVGRHLVGGYSKPGLRDTDVDVYPFTFLPRLQRMLFDACVAQQPVLDQRDVLDCYFTSYFNAWLDNQNLHAGPKRLITGFMPRTILNEDSVERFFAAYPDGFLVSLVRDPRAWYASASRHRSQYEDPYQAIRLWKRSADAARKARARYGERVAILTYEELVQDTEAAMSRLAEQIGIEMSPVLLAPTFNGRPIRANSSDPVAGYGVLAERVEAYREVLDPDAIAQIDELAGRLYDDIRALARV